MSYTQNECADPVVDIPIAETIVHENYVPNANSQAHDIALIRLQRAAPNTEFCRPICLPFGDGLRNKNFDGAPLTVAGFGRTLNGICQKRTDTKLALIAAFN